MFGVAPHLVDQLLAHQSPAMSAPEVAAVPQGMLAKEIPLTLAAMSAGVGAVVVVFVLFGLQSLDRDNIEKMGQTDRLPMGREIAAIHLLLITSSIAMFVLLLTPVFLIYNLASQALASDEAVAIGLGLFSFSVTTLIVALFAYFKISTIRLHALEELSRDLEPPIPQAST